MFNLIGLVARIFLNKPDNTHAVFHFPQDFTRAGMNGTYFIAIPLTDDKPLLWCAFGKEDDMAFELEQLAMELAKGSTSIDVISFTEGAMAGHEDMVRERAYAFKDNYITYKGKVALDLGHNNIGFPIGEFALNDLHYGF